MTLNRLAGRQAVCFQALQIVQHKKGGVNDLRKLRNGAKRNEAILSFLFSAMIWGFSFNSADEKKEELNKNVKRNIS